MGLLQLVEYFTARKDMGAATTFDLTFFGGQTPSATEINDLGVDGILPDNAEGDLTAVFLRNSSAQTTLATGEAAAVCWIQTINRANVSLSVAGVKVIDAPVWAAGGPPEWWSGAANTPGNVSHLQNGGYMISGLKHPIHQRGRIVGRLYTKLALAAAPATQHASMTIQVVTRKAIAG